MSITKRALLVTTVMLAGPSEAAKSKLPKGVVLPEGVELPDDFELPAGIVIPEGFVITQDMVDQYIRYMENKANGSSDSSGDNAWFKQIATGHENANL